MFWRQTFSCENKKPLSHERAGAFYLEKDGLLAGFFQYGQTILAFRNHLAFRYRIKRTVTDVFCEEVDRLLTTILQCGVFVMQKNTFCLLSLCMQMPCLTFLCL